MLISASRPLPTAVKTDECCSRSSNISEKYINSNQIGKIRKFSEDMKQTMVKLALKGYCLPKIGQLVNKNTFNCKVYC